MLRCYLPEDGKLMDYVTKDSGVRQEYDSGMRRDTQDGKPDFSLCLADDVPFEDQMLTRWAALMTRGAAKYGRRNHELASSDEEMERFRASALRHMIQWLTGDTPEEDHAAAVYFNIFTCEGLKSRRKNVGREWGWAPDIDDTGA
jgi:hypothetical protein